MERIRQSRPESDLGFQAEVLEILTEFPPLSVAVCGLPLEGDFAPRRISAPPREVRGVILAAEVIAVSAQL